MTYQILKNITGIILAGGRSSRFGRDKGLFPFRGKPLVEHAIDILQPIINDIRISTNQPETYAYLGLPMIGDIHQGCGPLGGMHAALLAMPSVETRFIASQTEYQGDRAMGRQGDGATGRGGDKATGRPGDIAEAIAVISCDTPLVPPELYGMLLENLGEFDAVVPVHGDYLEATCAIYTTNCLPVFEEAILAKRFKIVDALKKVNTLFLNIKQASFYHPGIFHNINTIDDTRTIDPIGP